MLLQDNSQAARTVIVSIHDTKFSALHGREVYSFTLMTRLLLSRGMSSQLQVSSSCSLSGIGVKSRLSPKSMTYFTRVGGTVCLVTSAHCSL